MKINALTLVFTTTLLFTACQDKYPAANMLDEPLSQPLEIIIEPKKVAMTSTWAAGIKDDGTLWTWGSGSGKIRKTTTGKPVDPTPFPVEGINDAVAVSGGSGHMLLLRKDGTVWGWGYNYYGEVDPISGDRFVKELRKIEGINDVVDIAAGTSNSFFLTKKGEVYTIGGNDKGWTNGINEPNRVPTKMPNLVDIVRFAGRGGGLIALNSKGELYSTGISRVALGRTVTNNEYENFNPAQKIDLPRKVVDISVTGLGYMALLDNGDVWVWGHSSLAGLALPKGQSPELPIKHPTLRKIANIGDRAAVDVDGNLYIWGGIGYGNPNYPFQSIYRTPIKIAENIDPALLLNGNEVSAVLDKQGNLHTWGWDTKGQLGIGKELTEKASEQDVLTVHKSLFTTY
ncbi:MAG: hypothetical protein Q4G13_02935 [Moraxella sp.]|nr:hypothetical protein [Moraxella sp.]